MTTITIKYKQTNAGIICWEEFLRSHTFAMIDSDKKFQILIFTKLWRFLDLDQIPMQFVMQKLHFL